MGVILTEYLISEDTEVLDSTRARDWNRWSWKIKHFKYLQIFTNILTNIFINIYPILNRLASYHGYGSTLFLQN